MHEVMTWWMFRWSSVRSSERNRRQEGNRKEEGNRRDEIGIYSRKPYEVMAVSIYERHSYLRNLFRHYFPPRRDVISSGLGLSKPGGEKQKWKMNNISTIAIDNYLTKCMLSPVCKVHKTNAKQYKGNTNKPHKYKSRFCSFLVVF